MGASGREAPSAVAIRYAHGRPRLAMLFSMQLSAGSSVSPASILEHIDHAVFAVLRGNRVAFANPAAARLLGLDSDSRLLGTPAPFPAGRLVAADDQGRAIPGAILPLQRALEGEATHGLVIARD